MFFVPENEAMLSCNELLLHGSNGTPIKAVRMDLRILIDHYRNECDATITELNPIAVLTRTGDNYLADSVNYAWEG